MAGGYLNAGEIEGDANLGRSLCGRVGRPGTARQGDGEDRREDGNLISISRVQEWTMQEHEHGSPGPGGRVSLAVAGRSARQEGPGGGSKKREHPYVLNSTNLRR